MGATAMSYRVYIGGKARLAGLSGLLPTSRLRMIAEGSRDCWQRHPNKTAAG